MPRRLVLLCAGVVSGLWVPGAWLMWRAFDTRRAWWLTWGRREWSHHYALYVSLALFSAAFLSALGYLIGRRVDELAAESETARDSNLRLAALAETDGLTGLFNARSIHERLDIELENAYRSPLNCLLIDLDHFKRINDKHGHPFGDEVLAGFARVLKAQTRHVDIAGRLGGEEFIVILCDTSSDRARQVAERIRAAVEAEPFVCEGKRVRVTISVGLAAYPSTSLRGKESLMKAADEALYRAKRSGRNRVVVWTPDATSGARNAA